MDDGPESFRWISCLSGSPKNLRINLIMSGGSQFMPHCSHPRFCTNSPMTIVGRKTNPQKKCPVFKRTWTRRSSERHHFSMSSTEVKAKTAHCVSVRTSLLCQPSAQLWTERLAGAVLSSNFAEVAAGILLNPPSSGWFWLQFGEAHRKCWSTSTRHDLTNLKIKNVRSSQQPLENISDKCPGHARSYPKSILEAERGGKK